MRPHREAKRSALCCVRIRCHCGKTNYYRSTTVVGIRGYVRLLHTSMCKTLIITIITVSSNHKTRLAEILNKNRSYFFKGIVNAEFRNMIPTHSFLRANVAFSYAKIKCHRGLGKQKTPYAKQQKIQPNWQYFRGHNCTNKTIIGPKKLQSSK